MARRQRNQTGEGKGAPGRVNNLTRGTFSSSTEKDAGTRSPGSNPTMKTPQLEWSGKGEVAVQKTKYGGRLGQPKRVATGAPGPCRQTKVNTSRECAAVIALRKRRKTGKTPNLSLEI